MTTIALILVLVVVFFVGVISPHAAGKIQRKTDAEASWLMRTSRWCWDPIEWWLKLSINTSRRSIDKVAKWGKKTNKKL